MVGMSKLQRLMTKMKSDARKLILPMMVILTTVKVSLNGEGYLGQKHSCDLDSDGDMYKW